MLGQFGSWFDWPGAVDWLGVVVWLDESGVVVELEPLSCAEAIEAPPTAKMPTSAPAAKSCLGVMCSPPSRLRLMGSSDRGRVRTQ
jgi:hypothetical protein